jgi:hypothetical protein
LANAAFFGNCPSMSASHQYLFVHVIVLRA